MTFEERVRCPALRDKIISPQEAAEFVKAGMTVAIPHFNNLDSPVRIESAVLDRARASGEKLELNVISTANCHPIVDTGWAEAGIIRRRMDFIGDPAIRKLINTPCGVEFQDPHLSHVTEHVKHGWYGSIDLAVISVAGATEDGKLLPSVCEGFVPTMLKEARGILLEVNLNSSEKMHLLHDVYTVDKLPDREPVGIRHVADIIGTNYYECDLDKILGVVISEEPLYYPAQFKIAETDPRIDDMAEHFTAFVKQEVSEGRLPPNLLPLQIGAGAIADAVLGKMAESFDGLEIYTEGLMQKGLELLDRGIVKAASTGGFGGKPETVRHILEHADEYVGRLVIRPAEITNHPEVIRRLGLIAMNNMIEADIYGNVNSTNVLGTKMMSGIGGSCDFSRNAYLTVFFSLSTAKDGNISCIVPFCSHIDSTEHDVNIIVTEYGVADLRNKSPRERVPEMIKIAHPDYRPMLQDYYDRAVTLCGPGAAHTPHILEEALSWHVRARDTGSMKASVSAR